MFGLSFLSDGLDRDFMWGGVPAPPAHIAYLGAVS